MILPIVTVMIQRNVTQSSHQNIKLKHTDTSLGDDVTIVFVFDVAVRMLLYYYLHQVIID